jgi:glutamate-1-semialdehyde 2,1-aminomutase
MLPLLRETTRQAGAVLIFDEVVTGFRVSPGGVQAATGVVPDLTTLAKVLAGGLPGGAVAGKHEIVSLIEFKDGERGGPGRIMHPGTFNANPLSAAAGGAALEVVSTGTPHEHAGPLTRRLVSGLNAALRAEGVPGCAYGQASMFHTVIGAECPPPIDGFEWDWEGRPGARVPPTPGETFWALRRGMLNEGVDLMGTGGMVSAVHTEADIDRTLNAFLRTVRRMKEEGAL